MTDNPMDLMMPISITEFVDGISVPVDLYVKLNEAKYILIVKAGTKAQRSQITSYKDRKIDYLWVKKSEYGKISHQNVTLAGIAVSKDNIRLDQKSVIISAAGNAVFTQMEHMGISLEVYHTAKQVTDATLVLVENHKDLSKLIESLNQSADDLLNHSMAVSALSVLIGQEMGWEKKATLEKLALGGLLHDIGLKTIPPELIKKPAAQMTFEETQLYETHAFRGMQLLQSLGVVPDDIVSIVYEHHENSLGQGYPQRIRDIKIHPMAKVVALADQFCYLTMKNPNNPIAKTPRETLMFIEHTLGTPFNKEAFKALKNIVNGQSTKAA